MTTAAQLLTTFTSNPLGQFIGTAVRSTGETAFGLGTLGAIHQITGVSLAIIAWMQAEGVKSNEQKENVAEDEQLNKPLQERAVNLLMRESWDLFKTVGVVIGGAGMIFAGVKMGGDSFAEGIASKFTEMTADKQFILIQFAASTMMTAGNTIASMGAFKAFQALFSVSLAGQSALVSKGVSANEEREGHGGKIGQGLWTRAVRFITNDLIDIPKALLVSGLGLGFMYIGARLGGQSMQASVTNLLIARFNTTKL